MHTVYPCMGGQHRAEGTGTKPKERGDPEVKDVIFSPQMHECAAGSAAEKPV